MQTASFIFPNFDPVAIQLGPLAIRWYALAYITGIIVGWRYALHLIQLKPRFIDRVTLDDFIVWATMGVILGGRLGYVLFYKPSFYAENPLEILYVWHGGMSFHGGLIGVLTAIGLFAWKRGLPVFALGDVVAACAPIGLFFGRLANFINGELYGRVTDSPFGVIFCNERLQSLGGCPAGMLPRHPSQLYEATMEGVILFLVLAVFAHRASWRERPGTVGGLFLLGYGIARTIGELFREPDSFLGFIVSGITMGQILSVPLWLAGLYLIVSGFRRPPLPDKPPVPAAG